MNFCTRLAALIAQILLLAALGNSQAPEPSPADQASANSGNVSVGSAPQSSLRSKPGEFLKWIDTKGLMEQTSFVNDWSGVRGGACSSGSVNRYLFKSALSVDTGKLAGWKGGTGLVSLYHRLGGDGSEYVGDAQGFSNIDAAQGTGLYEAWFEQKFWGDWLRIKAGKVDANTEFAVVENSSDFLNSSMGYSPTILSFPTYPDPRPSVNVFVRPIDGYYVGAGIYDLAHAGAMPIIEAGRRWKRGDKEMPGRLAAGFWHQNGPVSCLGGGYTQATKGFYLVMEQTLWTRTRAKTSSDQTLSAFTQYGRANGDISPFTHHLGGGLVFAGLLPNRPKDSIGLGLTWVRFTEYPRAGFQQPGELTLETYYKVRVNRLISVGPDMQYIHNPSGLRCQTDSVVFTPRVNVSF